MRGIEDGVEQYLNLVKKDHNKGLEDYRGAINAFVECKEHPSTSDASTSTYAHDHIYGMLYDMEHRRLVKRGVANADKDMDEDMDEGMEVADDAM